jgi:hypothetical protein
VKASLYKGARMATRPQSTTLHSLGEGLKIGLERNCGKDGTGHLTYPGPGLGRILCAGGSLWREPHTRVPSVQGFGTGRPPCGHSEEAVVLPLLPALGKPAMQVSVVAGLLCGRMRVCAANFLALLNLLKGKV